MVAELAVVVEGGAVDSPLRWAWRRRVCLLRKGEAVAEILRDIEICAA
jgi:hypothetical protein